MTNTHKLKIIHLLVHIFLCNAAVFQEIIPIVKHHHERYDGKGYPSKLAGDQIPYLARVAAVVDAFDAMTSKKKSI